ncbi:ACP S-malonyltransferase [Pseudoalteromonas luteoviolacea]|uniref:ACP S-malonyltransferase n=1 Tax=Pseudoalteromonas luteoviolacea TaxID=43657 RepID=UPI001B36F7E3|nr:ACP S-malonyltransferase [Pseudoalteromonas luteoviolacea]MBQ4839010.1 ACP S-malonyltransferase [Pseudoalteromonas luteoviolacea]
MKAMVFPGQGSQEVGMGGELFDEFVDYVRVADDILGYSIKELCLVDPNNVLSKTQYTQPALYVVNALHYLKSKQELSEKVDFYAGHSLGEYTALFASGAFSFETGLRLVKKRGELMSTAKNGVMAAVIGLDKVQIHDVLKTNSLNNIDVANYNGPVQTIISGLLHDIEFAKSAFEARGAKFIKLPVSAAFHSRYMKTIEAAFGHYLQQFTFGSLSVPVISNVTAKPYQADSIAENLTKQISSPVHWVDSISYINATDQCDFEEVGPGNVLSKLISSISNKENNKEVA